jgi:hypothetical protein
MRCTAMWEEVDYLEETAVMLEAIVGEAAGTEEKEEKDTSRILCRFSQDHSASRILLLYYTSTSHMAHTKHL